MADEKLLQEVLVDISKLSQFGQCTASFLAEGGSNWVYQLTPDQDPTAKGYCLRVCKPGIYSQSAPPGLYLQQRFAACGQTNFVPRVHHLTPRFCIMDLVEGEQLQPWSEFRKDSTRRGQVLDGLATFLCQTWRYQDPQTLQPGFTYRDWLLQEVGRCFRRAVTQAGRPWGDPLTFLTRCYRVEQLARGTDGDGWAYLQHRDFNEYNIIVDSTGLKGIVDWDWTILVPFAASVHFPMFLVNIPGWTKVGEGMDFAEDREDLVALVKDKLKDNRELCERVEDLLGTSQERLFFEVALSNRRVNQRYIAQMSPTESHISEIGLKRHLAELLSRNMELWDNKEVEDLEIRIEQMPE